MTKQMTIDVIGSLRVKAPITTKADNNFYLFIYFFFIFRRKQLDISLESSAKQMIHMKYQDLFSLKYKKIKILECGLLQILLGALRVMINTIWESLLVLTVTISNISCLDMYPFPSKSYMLKAHFNFCSNLPRDVTLRAQINSRKSIVPSELESKVRNTCSANFDASPYGKKFPYIFLNSSTERWPLGQSLRNPLYHSWSSSSENSVFLRRSSRTSGFSLLLAFPISHT